jgi:hypothetical protein
MNAFKAFNPVRNMSIFDIPMQKKEFFSNGVNFDRILLEAMLSFSYHQVFHVDFLRLCFVGQFYF